MTDIWDAEEPEMVDRGDPICPILWESRDQASEFYVIFGSGGQFSKLTTVVCGYSDTFPMGLDCSRT